MALSTNILGVWWDQGKYSLHPANGGLRNERTLIQDPRFRELPISSGYMDHCAVLSLDETLALATEDHGTLKDSLAGAAFVIVHIYEWESGY